MSEETEGKQLASGLTLRRKKPIDYSEATSAVNVVKDFSTSPVKSLRKRKQKSTESDLKNRPRLVPAEERKSNSASTSGTPIISTPNGVFKVIRPKIRSTITEYHSLANELDDFEGPKVSFSEAGITSFDMTLTGLQCTLCSHRTQTVSELERHLSLHPETFESCSLCASSDEFSMEGFSEHLLSHFIREPPYFICLFCNVKLSKVHYDAVQHLLYHCPSLPSCLLCGDDIEDNGSANHRQTVHNKLMHRFCCVSCLKGFASLTSFANHSCMITYRCVCDLSIAYRNRGEFEAHLNATVLSEDKIHSLLVPDTRTHNRRVYFINVASIAGESIERKDWRNFGFLGIGRQKVKLGFTFECLKEQPTGSGYSDVQFHSSPNHTQPEPVTPGATRFVLTRPKLRVPPVAAGVIPPTLPSNTVPIRILRPKAPLNLQTNLPQPETSTIQAKPFSRFSTASRNKFNNDPNLLYCNYCDAQFRYVSDLAEHLEKQHNKDTTLSDKVPIGAMLSICRPCKILFESPTQFRAHIKQHEILGQQFLNCGCCSFVGSTVVSIRHHQTTSKFWGCLPCQLRFTEERAFFYHVVTKKHARVFFFCKTCNLGCTDIGLVVTHQRSCSGIEIGMVILNTFRYRPLDKVAYESMVHLLSLGYNSSICCRTNCSLFATSSSYVLESCCYCLHTTPINAPYLSALKWAKGDGCIKPVVSLPMFAKAAPNDVILQPVVNHISISNQFRQQQLLPSLPGPSTSVRFLKPRIMPSADASRFVAHRHNAITRLLAPANGNEDLSPQKRICMAVNAQIDATAADTFHQNVQSESEIRHDQRPNSPEVINLD